MNEKGEGHAEFHLGLVLQTEILEAFEQCDSSRLMPNYVRDFGHNIGVKERDIISSDTP